MCPSIPGKEPESLSPRLSRTTAPYESVSAPYMCRPALIPLLWKQLPRLSPLPLRRVRTGRNDLRCFLPPYRLPFHDLVNLILSFCEPYASRVGPPLPPLLDCRIAYPEGKVGITDVVTLFPPSLHPPRVICTARGMGNHPLFRPKSASCSTQADEKAARRERIHPCPSTLSPPFSPTRLARVSHSVMRLGVNPIQFCHGVVSRSLSCCPRDES